MFAVFTCLLFYAGKRWYSHESEVNAKLWEIQAATDNIAESLTEKETPYIDLLGKTVLQDVLSGVAEKDHNAYIRPSLSYMSLFLSQ